MLETLKMSALGTVIGVLLAIPFAFLATTVVTENPVVTHSFRFFLNVFIMPANTADGGIELGSDGIGPDQLLAKA